jgi:hypothetical protein
LHRLFGKSAVDGRVDVSNAAMESTDLATMFYLSLSRVQRGTIEAASADYLDCIERITWWQQYVVNQATVSTL